MRIFATITPVFQNLVDRWFAPSLHRLGMLENLIVVVDPTQQSHGNGNFRGPGFDNHVINKLELAAKWAETERDPFLLTDVDIIYLRDFRPEFARRLGSLDVLLAAEWPTRDGYNIGQMVIRPSRQMADFLREVATELRGAIQSNASKHNTPVNQDYLNERLLSSKLRHASLPRTFASTGLLDHPSREPMEKLYSYHATATMPQGNLTSLERKHLRLAEMAAEYGLNLLPIRTPFRSLQLHEVQAGKISWKKMRSE